MRIFSILDKNDIFLNFVCFFFLFLLLLLLLYKKKIKEGMEVEHVKSSWLRH